MMVTFLSLHISNTCHSISGVAVQLQHTICSVTTGCARGLFARHPFRIADQHSQCPLSTFYNLSRPPHILSLSLITGTSLDSGTRTAFCIAGALALTSTGCPIAPHVLTACMSTVQKASKSPWIRGCFANCCLPVVHSQISPGTSSRQVTYRSVYQQRSKSACAIYDLADRIGESFILSAQPSNGRPAVAVICRRSVDATAAAASLRW